MAGEAIQYLARIAAVADAYDAMTAERPHRPAMSPADAWSRSSPAPGRRSIPASSRRSARSWRSTPGDEATLPDGRTAVVADVSLHAPSRPTVRVREGAGIAELVVDL